MRTETVKIVCDATGIPTGNVDRDLDADDVPIDVADMLDAPDGWLVITIARVRPNPDYKGDEAVPSIPANITQEAMQDFLAELQARQNDVPPHVVDTGLLYLKADKAHLLDQIMPGCFDELEGFDDLALTAKGGAT
jgi:hypothetical protein